MPDNPLRAGPAAGGLRLVVGEVEAGSRVDALLAPLMPGSGVRARRRAVADGRVLLDGKPARAGERARAGAVIELSRISLPGPPVPRARLVSRAGDYVFFSKPAGLHTVALAGRPGDSLEARLPLLMAEAGLDASGLILLQRLDFPTSGLVAGALAAGAADSFRAGEAAGRVAKRYVCLSEGTLDGAGEVAAELVSDGSGGMRCLPRDDPDPARRTLFRPLARYGMADLFPDSEDRKTVVTLVGCEIRRGARHQIRVHAASLGIPLLGDGRYGACRAMPGQRAFFLHHGRLFLPMGSVTLLPEGDDLPVGPAAPAYGDVLARVREWFALPGPPR